MLVLVCGPPAAGKTTLTDRLADRLADDGRPVRVARSDAYATRTYERLYERVAGRPARPGRQPTPADDWLLDGTFHRRAWRERFRRLAPTVVVFLDAPLDVRRERNRRRDPGERIDPEGVAVVGREFERPRADVVLHTDAHPVDEGFDRAYRVVRNGSTGDPGDSR